MSAKGRVRMQRIGLALPGGGFSAPVFHLGMIRREADILPAVHITSVPGRGIRTGAEWHRCPDSPCEIDVHPREFKGNS